MAKEDLNPNNENVSVHNMSTSELIDQFDNAIKGCLEDEWIGSINMEMDKNACGTLTKVNICDFLALTKDKITDTLYFDRVKFPPLILEL